MSLIRLIEIAPPPEKPFQARGNWDEVEQNVGFSLPDDFKRLIETYGSGSFADSLNPINPFSCGGNGLLWVSQDLLKWAREHRKDDPEALPFPIHPEPGGLFPWATTDNGDTLYWLTQGNPEEWSVVVEESRGPELAVYSFGATEFLVQWLSGALICPVFPERHEYFDPGFSPPRELRHVTVYFAFVDMPHDERLSLLMEYLRLDKIKRRHISQCVFQVHPHASKVTYSEGGESGSLIELAFPPGDEWYFKERVRLIPKELGWPISEIHGHFGLDWSELQPRTVQGPAS